MFASLIDALEYLTSAVPMPGAVRRLSVQERTGCLELEHLCQRVWDSKKVCAE